MTYKQKRKTNTDYRMYFEILTRINNSLWRWGNYISLNYIRILEWL